jgi:hypothetical protein
MKIEIEATPQEIKELLQAIGGSKEQTNLFEKHKSNPSKESILGRPERKHPDSKF